jgi:NADPH-dependent 2,4-dienoyl-CoA reductase/sulfur reductase-like enzyme
MPHRSELTPLYWRDDLHTAGYLADWRRGGQHKAQQSWPSERKECIMGAQHRKALIIGSGTVGPTLALFLRRAGIESEIYEARSETESYTG